MNGIFKSYEGWSLERISRHVAYWGIWGIFLSTMNSIFSQVYHYSTWLSFELITIPVKLGCSYTIAYWLLPKYLFSKRYFSFAIMVVFVLAFYTYLLLVVYRDIVYPYILQYEIYKGFYHDFVHWAIELIYISGLIVAIKIFQNVLKEQENRHVLQEEKDKTELKYLKNQIQPHFLFNTLNNLYGMVLSKDENSANFIVKLSDMLSYMLYESKDDFVPLEKELEHLDNYIKLEQLRYNRKLSLHYQRPLFNSKLFIAPQLLIPFVENAFKHGPAKEEGKSQIFIQFSLVDARFHMMVKNTFNESKVDQQIKSGIGLENVRKRLQLLYPQEYELIVKEDAYFEISLWVNLKKDF